MIGQKFSYHQPSSAMDVAALLAEFDGDAIVVGGGTMLVPSMVRGHVAAKAVIGLNAAGLNVIVDEGDAISIGAMTSYADILRSGIVAEKIPLLRHMADQVTGGPSIQNQGTVGGSVSFANPASDAPSCLTVLGAVCELRSAGGTRQIGIKDFLRGAFLTARRPDEVLVRIRIPVTAITPVGCYSKHKFCASSWPIVTAACVLFPGPRPTLRLSVGGAAPRPTYRVLPFDPDQIGEPARWALEIAKDVAADIDETWSDELADGDYRRAVVVPVVKRSLLAAVERLRS